MDLALLMRRAGCVGINFGVDNGDDEMLKRLQRGFGSDDILNAAQFCREAGIITMFDLLLGSPGESRGSIERTTELMKRAAPDRVGVSVGVRIYPGTALARRLDQAELKDGLSGSERAGDPLFYLEPRVAEPIAKWIAELTAGDERFLFFDPNSESNYNYNANEVLVQAIRGGCRGAYWDILRRLS